MDKLKIFARIAVEISSLSTCSRLKVGALLLSKDYRILATGYNGVASGNLHCEEVFAGVDITSTDFYKEHGEWSAVNEMHAEANLIAFSAKNGIKIDESILIVTYSPCINCAKLIIHSGISHVYYLNKYDRDESGLALLKANNINIGQLII